MGCAGVSVKRNHEPCILSPVRKKVRSARKMSVQFENKIICSGTIKFIVSIKFIVGRSVAEECLPESPV